MKKHIREVKVVDIIRYFGLSLIAITILWVAFGLLAGFRVLPFNVLYLLPIFIILTYILAKYLLIGMILLYKAYAPMSVRSACRFEPTCSTYMIMALNKYGLLVGFIKGIKRIIRCKPPHGGIDYP